MIKKNLLKKICVSIISLTLIIPLVLTSQPSVIHAARYRTKLTRVYRKTNRVHDKRNIVRAHKARQRTYKNRIKHQNRLNQKKLAKIKKLDGLRKQTQVIEKKLSNSNHLTRRQRNGLEYQIDIISREVKIINAEL